jgi:hypothetical protein
VEFVEVSTLPTAPSKILRVRHPPSNFYLRRMFLGERSLCFQPYQAEFCGVGWKRGGLVDGAVEDGGDLGYFDDEGG